MLRNLRLSIGPRDTISIALAPDGTFQMTAPDRQTIRVAVDSLPSGYSVGSLNYGNLDLLVNPIRFSATDTSELHLNLRKGSRPCRSAVVCSTTRRSYPVATFG